MVVTERAKSDLNYSYKTAILIHIKFCSNYDNYQDTYTKHEKNSPAYPKILKFLYKCLFKL